MQHPFFASVDFDSLLNRSIRPPFIPTESGITDLEYFPKEFTEMSVTSVESESSDSSMNDFSKWENFSFVGDIDI